MYYRLDHQTGITEIIKKELLRMLVLSDLHIGAVEAILHALARDRKGNIVSQTEMQKLLYEGLISNLKKEKIDILILLGDLVEGRNLKVGGLDIINTDTNVMTYWAYEMLSEIIDILKPKIVIGVQGSAYHIADGGSDMDERVIRKLSANFSHIDFLYDQKIYAKIGDKIWYLVHKLGGDWKNPPFAVMSRVWTDLQKSTFKNGLPVPTVIGAGHTHNAQSPVIIQPSDNDPVYGFVSPCQKIGDSFTGGGSFLRYPDIGYLSMEQNGTDLSGRFVRTYKQYAQKKDISKKLAGLYVQDN
jgi:hypothetical protein